MIKTIQPMDYNKITDIKTYTPFEVVNHIMYGRTTGDILSLASNQRLFIKTKDNIVNFFEYTYEGLPVPSIQIANQTLEFFNAHNFDGYEFDSDIKTTGRSASGLDRKKIETNKQIKRINLVTDGQQRLTMNMILFQGSLDGKEAYINLDKFVYNPFKKVYLPKFSIIFLDSSDNDNINIFKKGNYVKLKDVNNWKDMHIEEIMKRIESETFISDTELNRSIVGNIKEYYFNYKLFKFDRRENMSKDDIDRSFMAQNFYNDGVKQAALIWGYFNSKIDKHDNALDKLSKVMMSMGGKDVATVKDISSRIINMCVGIKTSFNKLLNQKENDKKGLSDEIDILKDSMDDINDMISRLDDLVSYNKEINPKVLLTSKLLGDDEKLGIYVALLAGLLYGDKYDKGLKINGETSYVLDILISMTSIFDLIDKEKSEKYADIRRLYNMILSNKGKSKFNVKNVDDALKQLFNISLKPSLYGNDFVNNKFDAKRKKLLLSASYGDIVTERVLKDFTNVSTEFEHNLADKIFNYKRKIRSYIKEEKVFGGLSLADKFKFNYEREPNDTFDSLCTIFKDLGDSAMNGSILSKSFNASLQDKPVMDKVQYAYNQGFKKNYLEVLGLNDYMNDYDYEDFTGVTHTFRLWFISYVRYITRSLEVVNYIEDKLKQPLSVMTINDIKTNYIRIITMKEDGTKRFNDEDLSNFINDEVDFVIRAGKLK